MDEACCPNCGAELPPRAKACPECGSDEQTGWSEEAVPRRLGIPDDSFDHEEFCREEFGDGGKQAGRPIHPLWWLTAAGLVVWLLYWQFGR